MVWHFVLNSSTGYNPHSICPLKMHNSVLLVRSHTCNHPTTNQRALPLSCEKTSHPSAVPCLYSLAPELQAAADRCASTCCRHVGPAAVGAEMWWNCCGGQSSRPAVLKPREHAVLGSEWCTNVSNRCHQQPPSDKSG